MKKLTVFTLFLAIMFCGSLALAGARGWGNGMGPGHGWMGHGASNLDLTDDQSAELQALREGYLDEIAPLQNQMIALRSEMRSLWDNANPDRDSIMAKQKEIREIRSQLEERATAYRLDCRAILTPEQQDQLAAARPGMGGGYGHGRQHHGQWD